jgi:hypothetical protein
MSPMAMLVFFHHNAMHVRAVSVPNIGTKGYDLQDTGTVDWNATLP